MKNIINYFYYMQPSKIHQGNKINYFDLYGFRYYLIKYDGNFNELKKIYNTHINLLNSGIYVHQIILNKDGQIVTIIDGSPYVMLKAKYYHEIIDYNDIINFSNIMMKKDETYKEWGSLWEEKNDYLEYQISKLGISHPILKESFNYYIALGETAIQISNMLRDGEFKYYLSHKRVNSNTTLFTFFNPLNLIIDLRVRDICEYFKDAFFKNISPNTHQKNLPFSNINNEIINYLKTTGLTKEEKLMFFARLLYPTYYFDLFEKIINGISATNEIKKVINSANDFEILLKKVYHVIKEDITNLYIEWLEI